MRTKAILKIANTETQKKILEILGESFFDNWACDYFEALINKMNKYEIAELFESTNAIDKVDLVDKYMDDIIESSYGTLGVYYISIYGWEATMIGLIERKQISIAEINKLMKKEGLAAH